MFQNLIKLWFIYNKRVLDSIWAPVSALSLTSSVTLGKLALFGDSVALSYNNNSYSY